MTSKRAISATNETATLSRAPRKVELLRLDFAGGVKRFHTEIGDRNATHPVHGSEAYIGIGDFGGLSGSIIESVSSAAQAVKFTITGIKSALISDALTDDYFMRDAEFMIGWVDASLVFLDDPIVAWSGFMDKVDVVLGDEFGTMLLTCESREAVGERASDWRFTDEDLQSFHPGDNAGEYVWRMIDLVIKWGGGQTSHQPGPGEPGGRPLGPNEQLR